MPPLLFTTATGEVFEMASPAASAASSPPFATPASDLESPSDYFDAPRALDGIDDAKHSCCIIASETANPEPSKPTDIVCNPSCSSARPLIKIVSLDDLIKATTAISPSPKLVITPFAKNDTRRTSAQAAVVSMVYNEYGELVDPEKLRTPPIASKLTTTGILRVFKKAFHHYVSSFIDCC